MDIGSSCVMCFFLSLCGELHPTYVPGTKELSKKSCPNPVHKKYLLKAYDIMLRLGIVGVLYYESGNS